MFPEFFFPVSTLYTVGEGKLQKISKRMHCFVIACVQTTSSLLRFLLRRGGSGGGGGEGGGSVPKLFYEGAQKLEKVMNTIMNTEIMNTFPKTFVQIVVIFITITFLPPMFASLYFYSFPNPPPPLPHFHCFPSTTTTITRNTTYLRNVVLCISLIINMKKQRRKIKNVVSPALIIQHANTNSDIICFIAKNCSLIFIC